MLKYLVVLVILVVCELVYFKIADHFNIIDKPNQRSSHTKIVLRGGGIIFLIASWIWSAFNGFAYPWFLVGVTLAAGISFVDDIHSLPDWVRLTVQFIAMGMMFYQLDMLHFSFWWIVILGLVICVGATNIYNFMDGINGITAGYSLSVLVPLLLLNKQEIYVEESLIVVMILATLVFSFFNFRPRNKAKCFAGDVGSVGIAFIILFILGSLVMKTNDITWLCFLVLYGVDGCCTIVHRVMLHEHLGEAHRKHVFQIMSNELGMGHMTVSFVYTGIQLIISLVMVYLIPNTQLTHWIYLIAVTFVLCIAYTLFMKKYYHLHEEYLKSLNISTP